MPTKADFTTTSVGAGTRPDGSLLVFTWNVYKNSQPLELACRHLKDQDAFVAAFQELPDDVSLDVTIEDHGLKLLTRKTLDKKLESIAPKIALVSSPDIEIDWVGKSQEYNPDLDDKRRIQGYSIRSTKAMWRALQVLGVHG